VGSKQKLQNKNMKKKKNKKKKKKKMGGGGGGGESMLTQLQYETSVVTILKNSCSECFIK